MTQAELLAQINALKLENEALKVTHIRKERTLSCKVSDKGAVSVYGFGRFPVTLYKSQWEKMFGYIDQIKAFITANESVLSVKEKATKAS